MSFEKPILNLLDREAAGRLYNALPRETVRRGSDYLYGDNLKLADDRKQGKDIFGPHVEEERMALLYPEIAHTLVDKAGMGNIFHGLGFEAAPRGIIVPIEAQTTQVAIEQQLRTLEQITGRSGENAAWFIKPERGMQSRGARPVDGHSNLVQEFLQQKPLENYVVQERIPFQGLLPEIQAYQDRTGKKVNPRIRALRMDTGDAAHIGAWHYAGSSITPDSLAQKDLDRPQYRQFQPLDRLFYRNLQNEVIPVTTNPEYQQIIYQAINTLSTRLEQHFGQKMPFISFDAAITPDGLKALQEGDVEAFIKNGFAPWELQPMPGWAGKLMNPQTGGIETEAFRSMQKMMRVIAYGEVRK